ncbi:MAG: XTP/dITP diphosphatase [Lachnospiraceae bacterium]|nr:XTP/dITP diphosphatase [Lachnospiraceae bacterium]
MKRKVVFATGNAGKMKEIREILKDLDCEVCSMKEMGIDIPIEENGKTFEENAVIKAEAVAAVCGEIVLADDSGLEIDYLNGEPGIYSARYMGEDTPYSIKNANLIERLKGVPEDLRGARFVCVIAAVFPDGEVVSTYGEVKGRIAHSERGSNGFGYDPVFFLPEFGRTTAELSDHEKNSISHRGEALRKMKEELRKRF